MTRTLQNQMGAWRLCQYCCTVGCQAKPPNTAVAWSAASVRSQITRGCGGDMNPSPPTVQLLGLRAGTTYDLYTRQIVWRALMINAMSVGGTASRHTNAQTNRPTTRKYARFIFRLTKNYLSFRCSAKCDYSNPM